MLLKFNNRLKVAPRPAYKLHLSHFWYDEGKVILEMTVKLNQNSCKQFMFHNSYVIELSDNSSLVRSGLVSLSRKDFW